MYLIVCVLVSSKDLKPAALRLRIRGVGCSNNQQFSAREQL
jgi:hypothetical protein